MKKFFKTLLPAHLVFIILCFISILLIFSIFRLVLLLIQVKLLTGDSTNYLGYAFFNRGLLFDTVTTSYLITLPFLILSINYLIGNYNRTVVRVSVLITGILSSFSVLVCLADIPYYLYYNSRLNKGIFSWTDDLFLMFKVTLGDYHYWPYLIALPIIIYLIFRVLNIFSKRSFRETLIKQPWYKRVIVFILSLGFLFFGVRGEYHLSWKPLLIEHAFKTPYPLINQLGLNPLFNFLHSMGDFEVKMMDDKVAIANVQKYLNVKQEFASPIARKISFEGESRRANIVLILIESLSADKMGRYNPEVKLTPYLDSLAASSICFDNIYTAGVHTYNGVFSTLYGLPALMQNKPTTSSSTASLHYYGLPNILEKEGYQNIFFCPNAKEFDNLEGFFRGNGIKKVIDEKNFPDTTIVNDWGVSDHFLFDMSIYRLDSMAGNEKPFFATFLTIATHSPYIIPDHIAFNPKSDNATDRSYEYTDWAISRFMKAAAQKSWYSNTIFVFIGDHGQNFDKTYEMPISYHHSPLIIYRPWENQVKSEEKLGLQIDVFPTILGFLQIPYVNNTLGIDLMRESRPFSFFSADNRLGCLNQTYYLIINKNKREQLFSYRNKEITDVRLSHKALTDSMKTYTFSNLQLMQYLIKKKLTSLPF